MSYWRWQVVELNEPSVDGTSGAYGNWPRCRAKISGPRDNFWMSCLQACTKPVQSLKAEMHGAVVRGPQKLKKGCVEQNACGARVPKQVNVKALGTSAGAWLQGHFCNGWVNEPGPACCTRSVLPEMQGWGLCPLPLGVSLLCNNSPSNKSTCRQVFPSPAFSHLRSWWSHELLFSHERQADTESRWATGQSHPLRKCKQGPDWGPLRSGPTALPLAFQSGLTLCQWAPDYWAQPPESTSWYFIWNAQTCCMILSPTKQIWASRN